MLADHPSRPKSGDKDSSSLCLHRGMCCNGELHAFARLHPDDDIVTLKKRGFRIVPRQGRTAFLLPCIMHRNSKCRQYAKRPTVCRRYVCKLLGRVRRGDIGLTRAKQTIHLVKDAVCQMEAQLLRFGASDPSVSIIDRYDQLVQHPENASEKAIHSTFADLHMSRVVLRYLAEEHFGKHKERS